MNSCRYVKKDIIYAKTQINNNIIVAPDLHSFAYNCGIRVVGYFTDA
jgi:hypothetical protein